MSDFRDIPPSKDAPPANKSWMWILLIILIPTGAVVCCCGGGAAMFFFSVREVANSETYNDAVTRAKNDPRVKELLGEPVEASFPTNSNYNSHNGVAEMQLQIPLTGPEGTATLHVEAGNHGGKWEFSKLEAKAAGGKVINLLTDPEKGIEPPEKKLPEAEPKPETP